MTHSKRYSPEVRERAVRMVFDHEREHDSQWSAIVSIATKIGCTPETLRRWVHQTEVDTGRRGGVTGDERTRIKELERELPRRPRQPLRARPDAARELVPMFVYQPVVLYDGGCRLCQGAVRFIQRHDRHGIFAYLDLASPEARRLLAAEGSVCDTMHLYDAAGHHERSTAVLRIAAGLGPPWSILRFLRFVPRPLRDAVYDLVARHRLRYFGRSDGQVSCTTSVAAGRATPAVDAGGAGSAARNVEKE